MIALPDLLYGRPQAAPDDDTLTELLEMAFLGRNERRRLEDAMAATPLPPGAWQPAFFEEDLFLEDFVAGIATIEVGDHTYEAHAPFLHRVLANPPTDIETIRFRQAILEELDTNSEAVTRVESLYVELVNFLEMLKSTHALTLLHNTVFRLDTLSQARVVIDHMASNFGDMKSGLRRLHDAGKRIQSSTEYDRLVNLIDYENNLAGVNVDVRIGADGRIRQLEIRDVAENERNRFYRGPWRRWRDLFSLFLRGYPMGSREIVNRLVLDMYMKITPALSTLVQVLGHLEVYLTARTFARRATSRGLQVAPAEITEGALQLDGLFNPLLLEMDQPPVPCTVRLQTRSALTLVTGPNSGGKTRLLQGIGLAQVMGQAGLYVPASSARMPIANGLFASLVYRDVADQLEGRLGTELIRIRNLFQAVGPGSLILLDELCSGTNPSEAAEIVVTVLRLLEKLNPIAFVTTHFLDLARKLESSPPVQNLGSLQVQINEQQRSTYQFVRGVADTSMAVGTARRLGVDFEQLSQLIDTRARRGADSIEEPVNVEGSASSTGVQ